MSATDLVTSRLVSRSALAGALLLASLAVESASALQAIDRFAQPAAKFEVTVQKDIMVPMRDGVRLATDLYLPKGAGAKLPVILMRTPYNKGGRVGATTTAGDSSSRIDSVALDCAPSTAPLRAVCSDSVA